MKVKTYLYDQNLMSGSSDLLRQALGGFYKPASVEDVEDSVGLNFVPPEETDVGASDSGGEPARDVFGEDGDVSGMVSSTLIGRSFITVSSSLSMFPCYVIPVSLKGDVPHDTLAEKQTSDQLWRTYINGGTFNEIEYPGVISPGPHDVNNFYYEAPYDKLYVKTIDPDNEASYDTSESKSVYNMYLPSYQVFNTVNDERALLNIYDLVYCSEYSSEQVASEIREQITIAGSFDFNTSLPFWPEEIVYPALIRTKTDAMGTSPHPTIYVDPFEKIRKYYYLFPEYPISASFDASQMTNILINKGAISDLFPQVATNRDYIPFYNKIALPAFEAGPLNGLIVKSNFSDLLLKSLGDTFAPMSHHDTFLSDGYDTGENSYAAQTVYNSLNSEDQLQSTSEVTSVSTKYVDFKNILASINNTPTGRPSGFERFIGENTLSVRAVLDPTGKFKHINKKYAVAMLDKIQNGLLSTHPIGDLPDGISADTYMPWSDTAEFTINNFMDMADEGLNYESECVALRVRKINKSHGHETNVIIQNQPAESDSEGQCDSTAVDADSWAYYDSQVKYGQTYRYETYAYFMVVGYKYEYSDLVISRKIGSVDQYDIEDPAAGVDFEYTCIEFYDPVSDQATASPMRTSESNMMSPERIPLLDNVSTYGYATAAQELAMGPYYHWADFNLKIEPTVRIFEVFLGGKELTVLDHPPPKIDVLPYQVKDQSQAVGFYIKLESPPVKDGFNRTSKYPTPIDALETAQYGAYLTSQSMTDTEAMTFGTVSRPIYVQVYRLSKKPLSMSDFSGNLVATKSLILEQTNDAVSRTYISPTCFHEERIASGHKFYYAFRFLNENLVPSPWSPVIETELIDDGGYKYAVFNNIMEKELGSDLQYEEPFAQFKKLLVLRPAIPQVDMNIENINYDDTAANQYPEVNFGNSLSDSLWNKIYKVRLTSKKTGRKIDLNVTYKMIDGEG